MLTVKLQWFTFHNKINTHQIYHSPAEKENKNFYKTDQTFARHCK